MITGTGQLRIGDLPLHISFTVPAGPCAPGALLPGVQALADRITDYCMTKAGQAGRPVSCQKGCGACCRQMVPVSPVEARNLHSLVEAMSPENQTAVRVRFKAAQQVLPATGLGNPGHPVEDKPAYRAYGLGYFRVGMPCPFLQDESCSIHPDRPLVCREYVVTSPASACAAPGTGLVKQIAVPISTWAAFGRSTSETGALEWMPLIHSLDYVNENPAPPITRTGPQHVEAFLKEMRQ